jgi:hypothetical protein
MEGAASYGSNQAGAAQVRPSLASNLIPQCGTAPHCSNSGQDRLEGGETLRRSSTIKMLMGVCLCMTPTRQYPHPPTRSPMDGAFAFSSWLTTSRAGEVDRPSPRNHQPDRPSPGGSDVMDAVRDQALNIGLQPATQRRIGPLGLDESTLYIRM